MVEQEFTSGASNAECITSPRIGSWWWLPHRERPDSARFSRSEGIQTCPKLDPNSPENEESAKGEEKRSHRRDQGDKKLPKKRSAPAKWSPK